jgi:hypothetical protein
MPETREPAVPRTRSARRALVLGSGAIATALLLGALAVVLIGLGQFPAALLLVIALLLGWWGKRLLASEEPAIR